MAKQKAKKQTKKRSEKYDGKLSIDGTLDDVLKVSIPSIVKPKK